MSGSDQHKARGSLFDAALLSAENRCSVLVCRTATLLTVTHLRHDVSVDHATTTHALVSFTGCM